MTSKWVFKHILNTLFKPCFEVKIHLKLKGNPFTVMKYILTMPQLPFKQRSKFEIFYKTAQKYMMMLQNSAQIVKIH